MTSRDRVITALNHKQPDKVPAAFECVESVYKKLMKHNDFSDSEQLYNKFGIDIRYIAPKYIGPELKSYKDKNGNLVEQSFWGYESTYHWTGKEFNSIISYYPLAEIESIEDVENYNWPSAQWFDYESIKQQCEKYKDKAIVIGHEGPFQIAAFIRPMEDLLYDMAAQPEIAKRIYDRMVEFELEYYERIFEVADGNIAILRPHDDYGTQISLLFSKDMWCDFFKDNTKKLVDLTHKYKAFYMQHSCGAVRNIIPELIKCGVDVLEPLQKVAGLEPENLKRDFGTDISFHGGIDTQGVLPHGTPEQVIAETRHYIDVLNKNGGYILMASQAFEGDVPIENIEAMYSVR